MNIKLEHYRVFNEIAQTLSFSTAARNLFISQGGGGERNVEVKEWRRESGKREEGG